MSNSPTLPPVSPRKPTPAPGGLATESDARLQAALAASARAEASLNGLFRSIQNLGTSLGGAREANETLTLELETLRDMLGAASEQHLAFRQKVLLLEQTLDRTRQEADADRKFLIEQQDAFIVRLLDEQEAELKRRDGDLETLRERMVELERGEGVAPSSPSQPRPTTDAHRAERAELERTAQKLAEDRERARETVQRLQGQRDEAQSAVVRLGKERDEALQQVHRLKAELGGPRISSRPPSVESRRESGSFRIPSQPGDLSLDSLEMEARLVRPVSPSQPGIAAPSGSEPNLPAASPKPGAPVINSVLSPPRSSPHAAPLSTRLSPTPSRLTPPPATNPAASSGSNSRPGLKQKPDASTRPLVGYSIGQDSIETEHLEGVRLSSKPPGRDNR